jgi:hypothetical protein
MDSTARKTKAAARKTPAAKKAAAHPVPQAPAPSDHVIRGGWEQLTLFLAPATA